MNFIAHYYLATRRSLPLSPLPAYALGTALPDLLTQMPEKVRLRLPLPTQAANESAHDDALRAGVLSHLEADAAFHKTHAFEEARSVASFMLGEARFQNLRVRHFFVSHILVELALDAVLLRREPEIGEEYYTVIAAAERSKVTLWTERSVSRLLPDLPDILMRFSHSRYLLHYQTDEGVARGLSRLCARARQYIFEGENYIRLISLTGEMVNWLFNNCEWLLSETWDRMTLKIA